MARGFVFKLEPVLRLRRRALEDAQRVVATRLRAIAQERSAIDSAEARIAEQCGASRSIQATGVLDVPAVRGHRTLTRFLRTCIAESEARIAAHEGELAKERAAMVEASVAVKSLEKLEQRRRERYEQEQRRREAAESDEIALQLHRRVRNEEAVAVSTER